MGTLYWTNPLFFRTCFAAFKNSPHLFVMSVGKGNLDNFIVKEYVPQPQILDRASVFISHGGMGGISEAMVSNVPMVLLPKTIEQQMNMRRIEELGAGMNLGCPAVDRLLDPKVSAAYVEATQSCEETGGAKLAGTQHCAHAPSPKRTRSSTAAATNAASGCERDARVQSPDAVP
ncbi:glycosyl transferase, putative [Acanthamoeba castellanii str. Neff]|uniref:Glycosyl transferase, putative n=1 Tax=Acanthamoeba castellanii (strain ATCC 30010 / Neff) TaxID=1257118 RepID=L8GYF0_ACACF|nr:glycosyl transferase, putative [Acanthamoeba castellanii str. Neff]ELR18020.1 glycosyl transferase, putative [Acanthamoeba castellanii str. Neff]